MLSAGLILQLLPLAIDAFGAVSNEVLELRQAAGLTDDELLSTAKATDAATLAAVQKHLAELKAANINVVVPATSNIAGSGALVHGQS